LQAAAHLKKENLMKNVCMIILLILSTFFSCNNKEVVQEIQPEPQATTPPTLEEISRMHPSQRAMEDKISESIDVLIYFETDNKASAQVTGDSYTIAGRVIPNATRLEVLRQEETIFNQDFSGNQAPHSFTVNLRKSEHPLAPGRNEYVFRLHKNGDSIDRVFVVDLLPQSLGDFK
jgi:hypothetical protein